MKDVSIISVVMNRPDRAVDAVANWLECEGVGEIIVIDWSSTPPLELPRNERLRVVRVESEPYFCIGPALNLAASLATCESLVKLDIDYRIKPSFITELDLSPGAFFRGCNAGMKPKDNRRHLVGFTALYKSDFDAVGGYHECFVGYGHDDTDLYNRLAGHGLVPRIVSEAMGIFHVPHSRLLSTENMRNDKYKAQRKRNISMAERFPWGPKCSHIQWENDAEGRYIRRRLFGI